MQKTNLKVLHVSPSYFPAHRFGGPIQSVYQLNNELYKDVDIEIITTNAGLENDRSIVPNQKSNINDIPITYFSFWGYEHYNFSIPLFIYLLKNVRKFDLVHITAVWNFPVFAASFACRIFKKPYIISPRGTIYPETIALGSSIFKKIYYNLIAKWCLKFASKIHYTSTDEQEKVEKYLALNNGFILPNGLNFSQFDDIENVVFPDFIPQKKYLLFLGRIDPKKGLDILLIAFQNIVTDNPDLILIVAGPDSNGYKSELQKQIDKLGLSENVIFVGEVHGKQKMGLYKYAKLFVLTSYSENFGMTVVEAMACGCLVLISDKVGIAAEIKGNQAGIITETNPQSIINGINFALTLSKTETEQLKKNATIFINQYFNIRNISISFLNVYKNIIPI